MHIEEFKSVAIYAIMSFQTVDWANTYSQINNNIIIIING